MNVYINDIELQNNRETYTAIYDISFSKTLKKNIDELKIEIYNIPDSFLPIEEKEITLKHDGTTVWGGIIKKKKIEFLPNGSKLYKLDCNSWEDKLKNIYHANVYSGYLYEIIPQLFSGAVYDSGFSFDIDTSFKCKKIIMENTVLDTLQTFSDVSSSVFEITPDKEIKFYNKFNSGGLAIINDKNESIKNFDFESDSTQLATKIKIRNCKVLSSSRRSEIFECDGVNLTFNLANEMKNISGYISSGGSGSWESLTIGIENLNDSGSDLYYNFAGKYINLATTRSSGDLIKIEGNNYYEFFYDFEDKEAIELLSNQLNNSDGIFEYMTSKSEMGYFQSAQDAIEYTKKIVKEKNNIQINGKITYESAEPLSLCGKTIYVNRPEIGISGQDFLVTKEKCKYKDMVFEYDYQLTTYLFGLEDIIERLLKKNGANLDNTEVIPMSPKFSNELEIIENIDINIEDQYLKYGGDFGLTNFA